ncbi:hypothetical protein [Pseudogemmobacter sonorensis]|uniref:hypothetical protein n=1 Tax=Pseudogemmobacter sonorensis TaxID=2989681 RepID=UPI0036AEC036
MISQWIFPQTVLRRLCAGALAAAAFALPALAWQSEVVFSSKQWQVEIVAWDDGGLGCQAKVDNGASSFSLWTFQDGSVQLQFHSPQWDFGDSGSSDLQLQIDRKPIWNLTNAELYRNSVLFTLPDSDDGGRFILEVAQGNRLFLRNSSGGAVQDYSLAGSRASIEALLECGDVITQQSTKASNPFN